MSDPNTEKQKLLVNNIARGDRVIATLNKEGVSLDDFADISDEITFRRRIFCSHEIKQLEVMFRIANHTRRAVDGLIGLMESERGETKRKACIGSGMVRPNSSMQTITKNV